MVLRFGGDEEMRGAARVFMKALILRDAALIDAGTGFNGMTAVLLKQPCGRVAQPISIDDILDFSVPPVRQLRAELSSA